MVDFKKIEEKWQHLWEEAKVFQKHDTSKKKKFYCLEMFPYPSASGLHMGHAFNYTIGDIYTRFKRMQGFNVLYPMGFDALGLPAENAAIKAGSHPKKFTQEAIKNYIKQMKEIGLSYDWSKIVTTLEPEYYKWNQYFFLKFLEKGLVYKKKAPVNYCEKCDTVLANEQVHNGFCWRHTNTEVKTIQLEQWFIKTTKYADELLEKIDSLKWPDRIKAMQKNWIGKSFGTEINFEINGEKWPIFTTRPDTIYGVTFMVVSAQHPKINELVTKEQKSEVDKFLKKIKTVSQKSMKEVEELDKEGAFTGSYAINPLTNEKVPVYTGNFVVADYGSGMVMAVPAHDQRDFEFAKKYNLPINLVIQSEEYEINPEKMPRAFTDDGVLVNSDQFSGSRNKDAIDEITEHLEKVKLGKKTVCYKLKDWLVSRQRYWGTPIPIIYCNLCGTVPVPEKNLPVELPEKVKFGKGNPLKTAQEWLNVKCPKCGKPGKRETDTMDTFFDSSWYFLRYCDNKNGKKPFDKNKVDYWMPVDQYIGGAEHACMHLIYARFFTKALRDLGFFGKNKLDEPFTNLFNQGMLHGTDGEKMSKSKGNVVLPEEVSEKYGMDTARFFLMSLASPEKDLEWSETGIQGSYRFLNNVISYFEKVKIGKSNPKIESKAHKTIKEVTKHIQNFKYNLATISIREFFEYLPEETSAEILKKFLRLLHPFCPHITEELWYNLGEKTFVTTQSWPKYDEKKINLKFEALDSQILGLKSDIHNVLSLAKIKEPKKIKIFIAEKWKFDFIKEFKKLTKNIYKPEEILKEIMKTELKKYGKDIQKIIFKLVKDPSKVPETLISQKEEIENIKSSQEIFSKTFKCEIEVLTEDKSDEQKAKQAMPSKPTIIVE